MDIHTLNKKIIIIYAEKMRMLNCVLSILLNKNAFKINFRINIKNYSFTI